uniref:ArnR1-like winged helix-turn-helix domain-containing protein n=1 Tax=Ignisphaera aggregans TaxID=334771 RepID=A0A7C5TI86_9CREN
MSSDSSYLSKLETLMVYAEVLDLTPMASFTINDLSKIWGTDIDKTQAIIRKLRKEGLLRRTRRGRYKLTLAGQILVKLYKRIRR